MSQRRPTIEDVTAAASRIGRHVWHTPLMESPWLTGVTGAQVFLKLETVQATGSFKSRGALNALLKLRETRPSVDAVTTASAGNHGIAMARAGSLTGIKVRVHLPATAPDRKKQALERYGAVVVEAPSYDEAEARARDEAASGPDVTFISAYSHPDVIAGAGTAALEMVQDQPDLDAFVVPLGGGGLLSGTALVARARVNKALIIGAEAEASPVFTGALAAGQPVTVEVHKTIADGLAGNMEPDSQTFGIVRDLVDRVVTVREPSILRAMDELAGNERLMAEGAAATAIGALLEGLNLAGRRVGVLLTGRNA